MIHKDKVEGVVIQLNDGDNKTEDITELHGKLAEEADNELVDFAYKILIDRGYKIIVPKNGYVPKEKQQRTYQSGLK